MSETKAPYLTKQYRAKRRVSTAASDAIPAPTISLTLDGSYLLVRCTDYSGGEAFKVARLFWEHPHGDSRQKLVLREVDEVPRQFESLVYGEAREKGE